MITQGREKIMTMVVPGFTLRVTKAGRDGIAALKDWHKPESVKISAHAEAASPAKTMQAARAAHDLSWNDVFGQEIFEQRRTTDPQDKQLAVDTLKDIQSFYRTKFGLGERDGNGSLLVAFKPDFNNAAYTKTRDGREVIVIGTAPNGESFAKAKDVLAHEYTHRVVNNIAGLVGVGETGAVNESLADTMAVAFEGRNWTIGEDVKPGGIRSLEDPGNPRFAVPVPVGTDGFRVFMKKVPMPTNVNDFADMEDDHGGVHFNMGIPNAAAGMIGKALGPDKMGEIYMGAIKNYLPQDAGIIDTAKATLKSSIDQFGRNSQETDAVVGAWRAVGLNFSRTGRGQ